MAITNYPVPTAYQVGQTVYYIIANILYSGVVVRTESIVSADGAGDAVESNLYYLDGVFSPINESGLYPTRRAALYHANGDSFIGLGPGLNAASLIDADLADADLAGAILTGANLTGADLTDADLTDADLTGADLTGADLTDATLSVARTRAWVQANCTYSPITTIWTDGDPIGSPA